MIEIWVNFLVNDQLLDWNFPLNLAGTHVSDEFCMCAIVAALARYVQDCECEGSVCYLYVREMGHHGWQWFLFGWQVYTSTIGYWEFQYSGLAMWQNKLVLDQVVATKSVHKYPCKAFIRIYSKELRKSQAMWSCFCSFLYWQSYPAWTFPPLYPHIYFQDE